MTWSFKVFLINYDACIMFKQKCGFVEAKGKVDAFVLNTFVMNLQSSLKGEDNRKRAITTSTLSLKLIYLKYER